MQITIFSFGFRYGIPQDADLVLDVRCLKNPFYEPALKEKSGLDPAVRDYIWAADGSRDYLDAAEALVRATAVLLEQKSAPALRVAVGCTGGRHRSVTVALALTQRLQQRGFAVTCFHRELGIGTDENGG